MSEVVNPEVVKVLKIVELRQTGHTWYECDQLLFPEVSEVQKRRQSPSAKLCKAHGEIGANAFMKRVYGCYTACQVVVKNPGFVRRDAPKAEPVDTAVTDSYRI